LDILTHHTNSKRKASSAGTHQEAQECKTSGKAIVGISILNQQKNMGVPNQIEKLDSKPDIQTVTHIL
jgi:hypothetical protein